MTNIRFRWLAIAFVLSIAPEASPGQERREPFRDLLGVAVQLVGFDVLFPSPDKTFPDPPRDLSGLSVKEWQALKTTVWDDVVKTFSMHRVPLLNSDGTQCCRQPTLVISVSTSPLAIKPKRVYVHVQVDLMEPAQLLRRPEVHERASTWNNSTSSLSDPAALTSQIRRDVRFWVEAFATSYAEEGGRLQ